MTVKSDETSSNAIKYYTMGKNKSTNSLLVPLLPFELDWCSVEVVVDCLLVEWNGHRSVIEQLLGV